jgi:glucosamine--fructose-6-phosphate aminotransferase (isomerizing)
MTNRGEHSFREIVGQGASWESAVTSALACRGDLQALLDRNADRLHVFIGCGSTHYLAQYAAPLFQELTHQSCRAAPSSELLLHPEAVVPAGPAPLVVALSRSGETSETIMAVEVWRKRGSEVLTVSCYDHTPLSALSSLTIGIPGGREESYAQTRSFAGMLVASQLAAALAANNDALIDDLRQLPPLADGMVARARSLAEQVGTNEAYQRITYLGSGALYGLANEATVKMKEMSLSTAEGYHFMEFRHGPMSLVDDAHLSVGLLSDDLRPYELSVLRDLKARGGHVLAVGNRADDLGHEFDATFALNVSLSEHARGVLCMPLLQLLAYYRSMAHGLNPDRPRNVVMSIRLEGTEMTP